MSRFSRNRLTARGGSPSTSSIPIHRNAAVPLPVVALIAIHVAAAVAAAVPPVPADLAALAAKAHTSGTIAGWCRGEFRPGRPGAFAAAVASTSGGGRYVV